MQNSGDYTQRESGAANSHGLEILIAAGTVIGSHFARENMVVRTDDSLGRQVSRALISIFPAPEATPTKLGDTSLQLLTAFASLEAAKKVTNSNRDIVAIAAGSQIMASTINASVVRMGFLKGTDKSLEDVGFSAISSGWLSMYLFHKLKQADSPYKKLLWKTTIASSLGALTLGPLWFKDKDDAKLAAMSHLSGFFSGPIVRKFFRYDR